MDRADVQQLAEEIFSLQLQSSEASDREDYGAVRSLDNEATGLETMLQDAGYSIEEDSDNIDMLHVLASDGTRYASFDLANWQWVVESEQS